MDYRNGNHQSGDIVPSAQHAAIQRGADREWQIPNGEQNVTIMNGRVYKYFIDGHRVSVSPTGIQTKGMDQLAVFVDGENLYHGRDFGFLYAKDGDITVTNDGIFTRQDRVTFENGNVYFNGQFLQKFEKFTAAQDRLDGKEPQYGTGKQMMMYPLVNRVPVGDVVTAPTPMGIIELLRVDSSNFKVVLDGKLAMLDGKPLLMRAHIDDGMVTYGMHSPDVVHVQTEIFSELFIGPKGVRYNDGIVPIEFVELPNQRQTVVPVKVKHENYAMERFQERVPKPTDPNQWIPVTDGTRSGRCEVGKAVNVIFPNQNRTIELLRVDESGYKVIVDDFTALINKKPITIRARGEFVMFGVDSRGEIRVTSGATTKDELIIPENGIVTFNGATIQRGKLRKPVADQNRNLPGGNGGNRGGRI